MILNLSKMTSTLLCDCSPSQVSCVKHTVSADANVRTQVDEKPDTSAVSSQVVNRPRQTLDHSQSRKNDDNRMHRGVSHIVPHCASASERIGLSDVGEGVEAVDRLLHTEWQFLWRDYPQVFQTSTYLQPVKHQTIHKIETTGNPVHSRCRRLSPEKLAALKIDLKKLLDLDVI